MRNIQIKKDKWYYSNYSIYENEQLVGEFFPENFKHGFRMNYREKSYSLRKISIWKEEKELYLGDVKIGDIFPKTLRSESFINIINEGEYFLKTTNFWKGIKTLYRGNREIGEAKSKNFETQYTLGDEVNDNLMASIILTTQQQQQSYIIFLSLFPIYLVVFT